jgi:hypothetical protein
MGVWVQMARAALDWSTTNLAHAANVGQAP